MKMSDEKFSEMLSQLERGITQPKVGWDLTLEQYQRLACTATILIPLHGAWYFMEYLKVWSLALTTHRENNRMGKREEKLVIKGYQIYEQYGTGKIVVSKDDWAEVYNSISEAHKDIFNY